jgi:CMP/dCMP kinase
MAKIVISGELGSGKSTVGKCLAEKLGYEYLSTGQIQRKLANTLGMTILELNIHAKNNTEIDGQLDFYIKILKNVSANMVIDSRLAWYFLPDSYSIYLTVDPKIAAERIFNDVSRNTSESYTSIEHALQKITERRTSENQRFIHLYNIDCTDVRKYDFVLDTSTLSKNQVIEQIEAAVARHCFMEKGF